MTVQLCARVAFSRKLHLVIVIAVVVHVIAIFIVIVGIMFTMLLHMKEEPHLLF